MAEKTYSLIAGTLLLSGNILLPAGIIWSVVMLSCTFRSTLAFNSSGRGSNSGRGFMLGPRSTDTFELSSRGGIILLSLIRYVSGSDTSGACPRSLGSVITPCIADATAVSGLHRYTRSSFVPLLPGKLRVKVLKEIVSVAGACPIPMHPRQPHWCILAPAWINVRKAPAISAFSNTCRLPGFISKLTNGCISMDSRDLAATTMSLNDELAQEPMMTWDTGCPATSRTGTTLSGDDGQAIIGSIEERSILIIS